MYRFLRIPLAQTGTRGQWLHDYPNQGLYRGLIHYWPINDGPCSAKAGSSTGHVADLIRPAGYCVITTNTTALNWKITRFGTTHLYTSSPTTNMPANNSNGENFATWSLAAWVNINSFGAVNCIINHGNGPTSNRGMEVDVTGKILLLYSTGGGTYQILTTTGALTLNKWYHLVGTFDGTNLTVYINGKQDSTGVFAFAPDSVAAPTTIGAATNTGTNSCAGFIKHVADWSRPLKPEEVLYLFTFPDAIATRYGPPASIHSPPTPSSQPPFVSPILYGGSVPFPVGNPKLLPPVGAF
jgi:hypothetical protein